MDQFARWLDSRDYSPHTIGHYTRRIRRIRSWLGRERIALESADWQDIRRYGETLPWTHSTRQGLRSALAAYWCFLERKDCPAWAIRCPKPAEPEWRGIEAHEKDAVLAAARAEGPSVYAMVCLLYYAMLRREEACRVRWDDIRDRRLHVVGKGCREAKVLMHPELVLGLCDVSRSPESPYVFPGRRFGTHLAPATANIWIRIVGARAGLPLLTPHMLRHTACGLALDTTRNLKAVAKMARHRKVTTTERYTRVLMEAEQEVLAAL